MKTCTEALLTAVWQYYEAAGRHDLPWRKNQHPYRVLVSEVMLQQTQVARVIPKYQAFLREFPTVQKLAAAPLFRVLQLWQGLGYNRRAKLLHATAQAVVSGYRGRFPRDEATLRALPGVGPYTAAAIMAFAYNEPTVLIETNVRTVFIHHCFKEATGVPDTKLLPLIAATVPSDRARDWYAALMDYGSYLKREHGNVSRRSRTYVKQSRFAGSNRQVRGAIVRALSAAPAGYAVAALTKHLMREGVAVTDISKQLRELCTEGLIIKAGNRYQLPH